MTKVLAVTEWGQKIKFPGENNLNKGSYQDFGDIWLDFSKMGINDNNVKDYRRELDIQTGIAATEFSCKDVTYKREHFVSNPDQVMVTELSASEKGKLDLDVKMELNNSGLEGKTTFDEKNQTCTIEGKVKDNDLKFCTTMKLVLTGGKLSADEKNQVYQIQDADCVMIVMAAIAYRSDLLEPAIFAAALAGACIGFLWFNSFPADIFMGDTGSLALGMALGCLAVLTKTEFVSLIIGGLFVAEALSVMIQVFYYKKTKKRIFLMAPLHHHFEKKAGARRRWSCASGSSPACWPRRASRCTSPRPSWRWRSPWLRGSS